MNLNEETSEENENKNRLDINYKNFGSLENKNASINNMEIDKNKEFIINGNDINISADNKVVNKQIINEKFLLNKKTKPDINFQINDSKENKVKKMEENSENKKEYDFGYSIIFLEDGEEGYIDDFLKEKPIESDLSDYYNFNLTEEEFQEILKKSVLSHYERHLKEEMEKRKKMQNMFMFNMNINMNNNIIHNTMIPQMNPLMMQNMNNNNGINYPMQIPQIQNIK